MQLTYSLLVIYNSKGSLSQLLITELGNVDLLPKVKTKMRIFIGNDRFFAKKEEKKSLIKKEKEDVETNWRSHIAAVLKEHIENLLHQDSIFDWPEKTNSSTDRKNLGKYDHFETVTVAIDVKAGFFERNFGMLGSSINFVAALANMGVQILSIEMAAGNEQASGRKYAIPMSLIAFTMAILTYNYSDASTVLSRCGKKMDRLSVVKRLVVCFPFKQIGSCTSCVRGCWDSLTVHCFPKSTAESSGDGNATCRLLARLVPPAVIIAMQAIWTTTASIEAFQTSYTIAKESKKVESFMTDDLAYGLALTLAVSSGISMGSFYIPFIANCIADWLKKVDRYYQSNVSGSPLVRQASTDYGSTQTSRRNKSSGEEHWELDRESQYSEDPVQSRRLLTQ